MSVDSFCFLILAVAGWLIAFKTIGEKEQTESENYILHRRLFLKDNRSKMVTAFISLTEEMDVESAKRLYRFNHPGANPAHVDEAIEEALRQKDGIHA